jgi:flagellar motility protein MotE (MotC chaperone)
MSQSYDQFFKKVNKNANTHAEKKPVDISLLAKETAKQIRKTKNKNQRKKFPLAHFCLFLLFSAVFFLAVENFDHIENYAKKIEIGLDQAEAVEVPQTNAESKTDLKTEEKKSSEDKTEAKPEIAKSVDESDFLFKLAERKKELDQREEDLNKKSEEIAKQKTEIETKLIQLEEFRAKISLLLKDRIASDSGKIDTLVQVYSNMKPIQAAQVFEKMDEDLVIEILGRMKKKSAADILNLIKTEKAQVFAEKYAGYRLPASNTNEVNSKEADTKP